MSYQSNTDALGFFKYSGVIGFHSIVSASLRQQQWMVSFSGWQYKVMNLFNQTPGHLRVTSITISHFPNLAARFALILSLTRGTFHPLVSIFFLKIVRFFQMSRKKISCIKEAILKLRTSNFISDGSLSLVD